MVCRGLIVVFVVVFVFCCDVFVLMLYRVCMFCDVYLFGLLWLLYLYANHLVMLLCVFFCLGTRSREDVSIMFRYVTVCRYFRCSFVFVSSWLQLSFVCVLCEFFYSVCWLGSIHLVSGLICLVVRRLHIYCFVTFYAAVDYVTLSYFDFFINVLASPTV